jgi:type IV pilus assembly protein PilA
MNAQSIPDRETFYRAAVGARRADYYAPKFLRFDQAGASKLSWNWSAFIPVVSFYWFLYRRMYGYWAVFCLLIPLAITLGFAIVAAAFKNSPITWMAELAALAYSYLVIPMLANGLYHRQIKRRIEAVRQRVPDPAVQLAVLENGPHTSAIAWVIALFLAVPMMGILAAIAIPAYQDYTIRAQVTEGLMLARPLQAAIVQRYRAERRWPAGLADVGISQPPSGHYVASIGLDRGTLLITYGNQANNLIAGHVLSLRPTAVAPGRIVWSCGYAASPDGVSDTGAAGPAQTDIKKAYLPTLCKMTGR